MVDVLQQQPGKLAALTQSIAAIPDPQIKQLLQGMEARAAGSVAALEKQIAGWFDTAMDRVSGAYKRQAQLLSFAIGLALAAAMNVDATHIATALWQNPTLAGAVADTASRAAERASQPANAASQPVEASKAGNTTTADDPIKQLKQLPIGFGVLDECDDAALACVQNRSIRSTTVFGWLLTAVASVLGAPFWFDLLQRFVQLRGAGPKPKEADAR